MDVPNADPVDCCGELKPVPPKSEPPDDAFVDAPPNTEAAVDGGGPTKYVS